MKTICLVANNPSVCYIPDEYDWYVHFNWANNFALTPRDKSIMAMRVNDVAQLTNKMKWHHYCAYAKKTIAVGDPKSVRKIDKRIEIIDTTKTPHPPDSSPNPTSGFAAIHHFMNRNYEVTLCGFDIESAIYYHSSRHPLDWEKEQIAKLIEDKRIKTI